MNFKNPDLFRRLYSALILVVMGMLAVASVPLGEDAPASKPRLLDRPAPQGSQVTLISSVVSHAIGSQGEQSPEKLELRVTWRNSGNIPIHIVKAELELFGPDGNLIERYEYPIYVAPGWEFGKPDDADAKPGIAPGATYTDPPGSGHLLLPQFVGGRMVRPTSARVIKLNVVE